MIPPSRVLTARQLSVKIPENQYSQSETTKRKIIQNRTDDGFPISSFDKQLEHLGTMTMNTVTTPSGGTFTMMTSPTVLQSKAFELLGLRSKDWSVGSYQ